MNKATILTFIEQYNTHGDILQHIKINAFGEKNGNFLSFFFRYKLLIQITIFFYGIRKIGLPQSQEKHFTNGALGKLKIQINIYSQEFSYRTFYETYK